MTFWATLLCGGMKAVVKEGSESLETCGNFWIAPKALLGEPAGGVCQAGDSCRILPLTFFWRCLLICGQTCPSLAAHLALALLSVIPSARSSAARATFLGIHLNFLRNVWLQELWLHPEVLGDVWFVWHGTLCVSQCCSTSLWGRIREFWNGLSWKGP